MADPIADLNAVLTTCGIANADDRQGIINEGFNSIDDLSILESDTDVTEMAKRMASCTQADGRVNLTTVVIKNLQTLVFWVRDKQYRNQEIDADDWMPQELIATAKCKAVLKGEMEKKDPEVSELKKFDPDDFELHEDAFKNLLGRSKGVRGKKLSYVIRDVVPPDDFATNDERRMYEIPLTGQSWTQDNKDVYQKLKAFLINTVGWTWIEAFDRTQDGRAAYLAWTGHYNGEGELNKRTKAANTKLKRLFYRSETSLPFESYSSQMKRCFQTLDKDPDMRLSARQQVDTLLAGIRTDDGELKGAKAVIRHDYASDFDGACAYFSGVVSELHGDAQLEYSRHKNKKRGIYAVDRYPHGRGGRGRGRFGPRSHGRGYQGRGGRGGGRGSGGSRNMMNGVDVSYVFRNFSRDEWERLGRDGRDYILQQRERLDRTNGNNRNPQAGQNNSNRNVGAAEITGDTTGGDTQNESSDGNELSDRGGHSGRGFGRGAYGGRGRGRGGRN